MEASNSQVSIYTTAHADRPLHAGRVRGPTGTTLQ